MSKKRKFPEHPLPGFFIGKEMLKLIDSWNGKVPAADFIRAVIFLETLCRAQKHDTENWRQKAGAGFIRLFARNQLMVAEILVAVERDRRSAVETKKRGIAFIGGIANSDSHGKLKLPYGNPLPYQEIADLAKKTGVFYTAAGVKMVMDRDRKARLAVEAKLTQWLALSNKKPET